MKSFAGCPEWIIKPSYPPVSQGPRAPSETDTYGKLHALGPSSPQLPRNHHLASLRSALHDEAQHAVAGSPHRQSIEQLVAERLALGDGGETAVLDLGGVEGDGVLGELEALLDEGGQFADAAPLLAEDFLGVCCADDWDLLGTRERMMVRGSG